jgi:hypothetical protein
VLLELLKQPRVVRAENLGDVLTEEESFGRSTFLTGRRHGPEPRAGVLVGTRLDGGVRDDERLDVDGARNPRQGYDGLPWNVRCGLDTDGRSSRLDEALQLFGRALQLDGLSQAGDFCFNY